MAPPLIVDPLPDLLGPFGWWEWCSAWRIVPDGVFRYGSVLLPHLLDNDGEVTTSAVFHEDVENTASLPTYLSWWHTMWWWWRMFLHVCCYQLVVKLHKSVRMHTSVTICFLFHLLILSTLSSLCTNICKKQRWAWEHESTTNSTYQTIHCLLYFADDTKGPIFNKVDSEQVLPFVELEQGQCDIVHVCGTCWTLTHLGKVGWMKTINECIHTIIKALIESWSCTNVCLEPKGKRANEEK